MFFFDGHWLELVEEFDEENEYQDKYGDACYCSTKPQESERKWKIFPELFEDAFLLVLNHLSPL